MAFSIRNCDLTAANCCCMDEAHMLAAQVCYLATALESLGGRGVDDAEALLSDIGITLNQANTRLLCYNTAIMKCYAEYVTQITQPDAPAVANGDCRWIVNKWRPEQLQFIVLLFQLMLLEQLTP